MKSFTKDADDQLDYTIDWTALLGGDHIDSAVWTVPTPLEDVQEAVSQTQTVVWIKGGVDWVTYKISCQITTASNPPRIATRSFLLTVAG